MHMHIGLIHESSLPTPERCHDSLENCFISLFPNVPCSKENHTSVKKRLEELLLSKAMLHFSVSKWLTIYC
jgi:hypothetical protein